MLPRDIDSPIYSRFITKKNRTTAVVWTELFFVVALGLLGLVELFSYKETICGYLLLLAALVMFHLWLMLNYATEYNSIALLNLHTTLAGFLAACLFIHMVCSMLYFDTRTITRVSFRNTTHLIWASLSCLIVILAVFAVGSHSRAEELKSAEAARQEFFKKILLLETDILDWAPQIPLEEDNTAYAPWAPMMLDLAHICALAIRAVYWLVVLACNFLGYSPVWVKNEWKRRQQEEFSRSLKIPSHLAVLYSDRSVSRDEISAFFDCCLATGIRRVTIYDPFGEIRRFSDKLKIIARTKNVLVFIGTSPSQIGDHRLAVQILPTNCGRKSLVETCKILSTSKTPVTVNSVSSTLAEKFSLSEPELLIQVGQTPSLAGYPPWTLRITEFVQTRTLPHSRFQFEEVLMSFNKRDIRVGK